MQFDAPAAAMDELFDAWDPDGSGKLELKELEKQLRRGSQFRGQEFAAAEVRTHVTMIPHTRGSAQAAAVGKQKRSDAANGSFNTGSPVRSASPPTRNGGMARPPSLSPDRVRRRQEEEELRRKAVHCQPFEPWGRGGKWHGMHGPCPHALHSCRG